MALGAAGFWQSVSMGVTPKAYTDNVDCADRETGSVMGGVEIECLAHTAFGRLPADVTVWTPPIPSPQEPSYLDLYVFEAPSKTPQAPSASIAPEPVATVAAASVGQLSEEQARDVLQAAGWPTELIPQALAIIRCESNFSPGANGDSGRSKGLFQLNTMWFGYAGEDLGQWADPLVNSRTALAVYHYEQARGYAPFANWSCRVALN